MIFYSQLRQTTNKITIGVAKAHITIENKVCLMISKPTSMQKTKKKQKQQPLNLFSK
jgi:deoxyinosine 3'endonuclease (endonuclease V)